LPVSPAIRARVAVAWAVAAAGAISAAAVGLFLLLALIGSHVPVNRDRPVPPPQVLAYVASNGVHTSIVVPVRAAGVDWRRIAPVDDVRRARGVRRATTPSAGAIAASISGPQHGPTSTWGSPRGRWSADRRR
jgi:hypothetical protein